MGSWARIHKLYHEHQANNPDEINERSLDAMKGRWKRLNKNANKWIVACKEASARKKSGMSQKDIEKEAHTIYTTGGSKFQDLVVFKEVMCKAPKWNLASLLNTPREHPESEEVNERESGGSSKRSKTSDDDVFTRSSSVSRPEGRDKAKKKGKGKTSQSDSNSEFEAQLYNLTVSKDKETELMKNVSNAQLEMERERLEVEKMKINMQNMRMKHKTLDALLARNNLSPVEEELKNELLKIVLGK